MSNRKLTEPASAGEYPYDPVLADHIIELKEICREIGAVEQLVIRNVDNAWLYYEANDEVAEKRLPKSGLLFICRFTASDLPVPACAMHADRQRQTGGGEPGLKHSNQQTATLSRSPAKATNNQKTIAIPIAGELSRQTTPADFQRFAAIAHSFPVTPLSRSPAGRPVEAVSESSPVTLRAYQHLAAETAGAGCGSWQRRVLIAALGLNGEAGEVADLIKKKFGHGHDVPDDQLADELGDVLWYLAELATALGLDLATIARRNYDKLSARYPDGFSEERSRNRLQ